MVDQTSPLLEGYLIKTASKINYCHLDLTQNTNKAEKKEFLLKSNRHFLKISSSVGFYTFSLLINFLTYSEKNRRYAVTGWYEVGTYRTDNKNHTFSHKTLMFYIPESDEEYDNAYFVTPEGAHCKQSFGSPTILRVVKSQTREYEAL